MKSRLILLLITYSFSSIAQGEFSSTFVDDRFEVYNGRINHMFWEVGPFLLANGNQYELTNGERRRLKNLRSRWMRELYLLKSELFWTKNTIEDCYDPFLAKKGVITGSKQFLVFLSRNLMKYNMVLYRDQDLKSFYFVDQLPDLENFELEKVQCKRTWHYLRSSNGLKQKLKCIGFFGNVKGQPVSFWLYFPKIKNIETLGEETLLWFDQLREFKNDKQNIYVERSEEGFYDLDALILEHYAKQKVFKIREFQSVKTLKGVKQVLNPNDSLVVDNEEDAHFDFSLYEKGVLVGKGKYEEEQANGVFEFYQEGVKVIKQEFKAGLREGKGQVYDGAGGLIHDNNYSDGFLDGEQKLFKVAGYDSVSYSFKDKMLQGRISASGAGVFFKGKVSRGLILDKWQYKVEVPSYLLNIISREPDFFQEKFMSKEPWFAKGIVSGTVYCTVNISYGKGEECLNKKCIQLSFLSFD